MVAISSSSTLTLLVATVASSKRGFAVNDEVDVSTGGATLNGFKSKISWTYNWDSTTRKKQPYAELIPMLWGTQKYHTNQWVNNTNLWLSHGSRSICLASASPRDPTRLLSPLAWRRYMDQFSGRAKLGAPAVSNDGYDWQVSRLPH